MASVPLGAASPSPCRNSNYDFTLRYERTKLFERVLFQFDANMKRTSQAMRDLATCFSYIGDSYEEVALCVSYATGGSAATCAALSQRKGNTPNKSTSAGKKTSGASLEDQEGLQNAARIFCTEAKRMRDGDCYVQFNAGVHKDVLGRLNEVHAQAKKTVQIGERTEEALKKLNKARALVEKKIAKYQRLGRPLTESKRYPKQKKTMDDAEAYFEGKAALFDDAYQTLMQTKLSITGTCIDSFLDLNLTYLCHLLQVLSCLAPHGAHIVYQMIEDGRQLGQRMGIPDENLLVSAVNPSRVGPNRRSRSAHNFTSFYDNRKGTAPTESGAARDEMDKKPTVNNRTPAEGAVATVDVRRARSPSARIPQAPAAADSRGVPRDPRPQAALPTTTDTNNTTTAAATAAGATPTPPADDGMRAGSHAPFGDTPKVQYKTRQQQVHQQQVSPPPQQKAVTTAAAATPSRTPTGPGHATRAPSHEPFDDSAQPTSHTASPATATAVSTSPSALPVERGLFSGTPAARVNAATQDNTTNTNTASGLVDNGEDGVRMRPTTATTLFDFPSIASVSTATPVGSQWATRHRLSAAQGGQATARGGNGGTAATAASSTHPEGPSAPPADDDDTGSVSASSTRGTVQGRRDFQPIQGFIPATGVDVWTSGAAANEEDRGRPTVSASRLAAACAQKAAATGRMPTQPALHLLAADGRRSSTSIPDLPAKGSSSNTSGQQSARSEASPALTPAGATSGTTTPPPAFDFAGTGSSGVHNSAGEGLVFVSWNSPKSQ